MAILLSIVSAPVVAQDGAGSYADDVARINNLHARYLFAYDWFDVESYVSTFAEDGVLDYGQGELRGRAAITVALDERRVTRAQERENTPAGERPRVGRHIISNVMIEIDGDHARSVAYWTHMVSGPTGYGTVDFFGHYEDDLVKVDGEWLYARRRVYNQAVPEWSAHPNNPAVSSSPPLEYRAPQARATPSGQN